MPTMGVCGAGPAGVNGATVGAKPAGVNGAGPAGVNGITVPPSGGPAGVKGAGPAGVNGATAATGAAVGVPGIKS